MNMENLLLLVKYCAFRVITRHADSCAPLSHNSAPCGQPSHRNVACHRLDRRQEVGGRK